MNLFGRAYGELEGYRKVWITITQPRSDSSGLALEGVLKHQILLYE